ncbi:RCC1 domain-containing protein [Kitasatospora sp. NPDC056184]|uniref:RCC1 domain-containing protein n=1 Tax=Kitasatospora sp. NPDC056184 TaxID=3345738 RepID=UPI0035E0B1D6
MAGIISSWGDNTNGQLGDGGTVSRSTTQEIKGLENVVRVAAGSGHALAVTGDGELWGFGRNAFGQLGDGSTENRATPVRTVGLPGRVRTAGAGGGHSAALLEDGTVWAWGAGFFCALGEANFGVQPVPVRVEGLEDVVDLAVGGAHNLALKADGTVWSWGRDDRGQLGDGPGSTREGRIVRSYMTASFACRPRPAAVEGLEPAVRMSAGGGHSLVVHADGTASVWGFNDRGQLGDGTTVDRAAPQKIAGLHAVSQLVGAYHHTVALLADGTVWAWGLNDGGQLGDGTTADRAVPAPVPGLTGVKTIAAGGGGTDAAPGNGGHALALLADGSVQGWGWNNWGQLAAGQVQIVPTPTRIALAGPAVGVAAGGEIPPTNKFMANPGGGFAFALLG